MNKIIKKAIKVWCQQGTKELLRSVKGYTSHKIGKLKSYLYSITDAYKITGPRSVYGRSYYEKRQYDPRRSDAQKVARVLEKKYSPDSIVDFGCAIGQHLELFHKEGKEVAGLEGNPDALEYALVPKSKIKIIDLRDVYKPSQKFDLAICIEVAEHIAEKHANKLVNSLSKAADKIVFTAATPGQGGTHHVNEQPRDYWISKFESVGFRYQKNEVELLRRELSSMNRSNVPKNMFVFQRRDCQRCRAK
jgi:SAM-dependent methyltransferase